MTTPLVLPTLTGRSCVLRPWTVGDIPKLAEAFDDGEIFKFDPRPPSAQEWISKQHQQAASGKAISLAVVPTREHMAVELVRLFGFHQSPFATELSFWVIRSYRRRGLAMEAAHMLVSWAFSALPMLMVVRLDREPSNEASGRIADGLGAHNRGSYVENLNGVDVELIRHELTRPSLC